MPRIVMINTVCSGSHGRIMGDLREAALCADYDVTLAYGRGAPVKADGFRFDTDRDVMVHVFLTRLLDRHARQSYRATRRLLRQLDALRPDLIHLHNVHGYYLHAPLMFAYLRERAIPTVWTHHDCWALTGHCSHFVRAACERWKTGCHDCPLQREYPTSLWHDGSRENWHWKREVFTSVPTLRIVSPSKWLDGVLAESYLQNIPRQVISSGVDLSLFAPAPLAAMSVRRRYGIAPEEAILLAVAAPFDARKGFEDVLQIAQSTAGRARVIMVGLQAKQLDGLPPEVIGIERTAGPEALVDLYAAADCLINPTYEDTYPTVNMEAMACGTPVAGYGVGGATEQLVAPYGMAVPVGQWEALRDAALVLAAGKPQLGAECRAYAEMAFDRRRATAMYMALYNEMTGATASDG